MKDSLSIFDLNIHGLEEKNYVYAVEIGNDYFAEFDQEVIKAGNGKVEIQLEKTANLLRLSFDIEVDLELECARSLEIFTQKFKSTGKHIYKFGIKAESINEDLSIITFSTPKINVSEHVFDFIFLSIPMKVLHPRFNLDELNSDADGTMVYIDKTFDNEVTDNQPDPRWAGLLKLKNKE